MVSVHGSLHSAASRLQPGMTAFVTPGAKRDAALRPRDQADLEQFRPALAGDEQAVAPGVVGDAVEHVVAVAADLAGFQKAAHVDPADHLAAGRIYAGDGVGHPD